MLVDWRWLIYIIIYYHLYYLFNENTVQKVAAMQTLYSTLTLLQLSIVLVYYNLIS